MIRNVDAKKSQDDKNQQNCTNSVQDFSKVTSSSGSLADERGGATNESTISSGGNNHESFTTLDSGGGITVVSLMLVDGKGFSGNGRLIDLDESVFGDDTTVGGNDGTFFDLNDITRNDFGSLDFNKGTVSETDSFESEGLFQFFDNGTSLEFLDETDSSVKKQKSADNTEIYPILKTCSKDSGSLDVRRV